MSGGFFNFNQHKIDEIATDVEELIADNDREFSEETLEEFKAARELLRKAAIYAQRIDWLVSGDDDEENFHLRLAKELDALEKEQD